MQIRQNTPISVHGQRGSRTQPVPADFRDADVRSLYIHIPFCSHKCHYCDFYSFVDTRDQQQALTQRLCRELHAWAPVAAGDPLRTIFVGGGTPSLLRPDLWVTLLETLDRAFDMQDVHRNTAEFTVECNPESVTSELLDVLVKGGVNRVSMGAQSFNPEHLARLERLHDPERVGTAVSLARTAGIERLSMDLIHAIPGQTLDDLDADLDAALAYGTEHLSCYTLTYEPNTPMTARLKRGEFAPCDEDVEVDMAGRILDRLRSAGLDRYEVSNYARPGAECRHNLAYWRQEQWLAAGPSASAHLAGYRWKNVPRLGDYITSADGPSPMTDIEEPDNGRALCERIMTGLRLAEGVDGAAIQREADRHIPGAADRLQHVIDAASARQYLQDSTGRWILTDAGFLFADGIAADLMAALQ